MLEDNTAMMFDYKYNMYRRANFDLIVASRWMHNMAKDSPLFEGVRIHEVPFGLDLDFFSPSADAGFRTRFGIPDEAVVICFRAQQGGLKGLDYIVEALERIRPNCPITLLTFANEGLVDQFADRFQLVELGWVNDEVLVRDAMVACDIFLMPSLAEAFGVMAIEAMACGKPVVCFNGTSLPEVTHAPHVGVAVPMRDGEALAQAIQHLVDHPEERRERGRRGRDLTERLYEENTQASRIAAIYREVVESRTDLRLSA
jgi:glycosyltransferase involved in cell wall biosynthesis